MKLLIENLKDEHFKLLEELGTCLKFNIKPFDEDHYVQKEFENIDILDTTDYDQFSNNLLFINYMMKIGGKSVKYFDRYLKVFDEFDELLQVIYYSKSLPFRFKKDELFKISKNEGERNYYVMENGYDNKNWLYTLKIAFIV